MRPYRIRKERVYEGMWWVMEHRWCDAPYRGMFCLTWEEARDEAQSHHDRWHREKG